LIQPVDVGDVTHIALNNCLHVLAVGERCVRRRTLAPSPSRLTV
jgi:hypothetical protein